MIGEFEINRIYLGDTYSLIKKLPEKSVDLVLIDPPYKIESLVGGGMLKEKRINNLMSQIGDNDLDIGIKDALLPELMRICKLPNIYIWCNKIMIPKLIDYFVTKQGCTFEIISWHKTNAMPLCGGKYLTDTEYCLYFKNGVKLNTTYDTAKTHYELPININDKNKFAHPNCKPVSILQNFILNSTNEGDTVFDGFCGSGSVPIACKNTNRNYIAFEWNPKWHKIACDRLNNIQANGQITFFTE